MGLIRNALRKLLDRELGVLGGELERLQATNEDFQVKLQAYEERFERLRSRVTMRAMRAERMAPVDPREEFDRLVEREQRRRLPPGVADDDYIDFNQMR